MALEKAVITNTVSGTRIAVLFNPTDYVVSRSNNFAQVAVPGRLDPILQFVHGESQTLDMELLLDTNESHTDGTRPVNAAGDDVRKRVEQLTALMDIDPTTHAPPVVSFTWASLSFQCVLTRAVQHFILFRPDGTPVRARVQVSFTKFVPPEQETKAVGRQSLDYSEVHTVAQGERISDVANGAYGDPRLWRPIALRNQLDDPRHLVPGTRLEIASLPFIDVNTGRTYNALPPSTMSPAVIG